MVEFFEFLGKRRERIFNCGYLFFIFFFSSIYIGCEFENRNILTEAKLHLSPPTVSLLASSALVSVSSWLSLCFSMMQCLDAGRYDDEKAQGVYTKMSILKIITQCSTLDNHRYIIYDGSQLIKQVSRLWHPKTRIDFLYCDIT